MPPQPRQTLNDRCKTGAGMQKSTAEQQAQFMQHIMRQRQLEMMRAAGAAHHQFANTNRPTAQQIRNRHANVLTERELEEGLEAHDDSGKTFRLVLLIIVLCGVALLAWLKWNIEEGGDLPQEVLLLAQRDAEIRGDTSVTTSDGKRVKVILDENAEQLEEYYRLLNVNDRLKDSIDQDDNDGGGGGASDAAQPPSTEAEGAEAVRLARLAADRERRLGNYRVKEALKASFEKHQSDYGQLVTCGRACESQHKQVQLAYETLNSKVDRELFGVLLDENVAVTGRASATPEELKEAYERKKAQVESDPTADEEIKAMELAEIKDAYDILINPQARTYYRLTGRKPPESMKHVSTTHGGWGQDLLLRTHKNRLILAWLEYLNDAWADYAVLAFVGFVGFLLPALVQLPRILEMAKEIEEKQFQMEEMEKRVAAGGSAAAPPSESRDD